MKECQEGIALVTFLMGMDRLNDPAVVKVCYVHIESLASPFFENNCSMSRPKYHE